MNDRRIKMVVKAPWWAPRGYTRGAVGRTYGKWWSVAVGRGLPTIVEVGYRRVSIEFPWWARGTILRSLYVRHLIRSGMFR